MKLDQLASNLYQKDGIWFSKDQRDISYPEKGNSKCFEVEKDSFWFNHRNDCITQVIKNFSKDEIFFDVGGGNGYVAKGIENSGIKTVLVEPGLQGALNAKSNGLQNIICSTFQDAGFKQNSCKAIGLFDVVEHIENDGKFIQSVSSMLKSGGKIYITVPAYWFLWSNEDKDAGHYRRYTTTSLNKLLQQNGFEIEYSTYIFSILPIPVFFFRTIPSVLGFNKKSNDLNKHKKEHSNKKGIVATLLDKIWNRELSYIKTKKRIPFGGSCLVVARKI